ncbi:MAG: Kelch repeat-containing protein [Polyangiales bacterium]
MRLLCAWMTCSLACSSVSNPDAGDAATRDAAIRDTATLDSSRDSANLDAGQECPGWCPSESLPEALQEISVTAFRDGFIVLGGFDGDGNIETSVHFFRPGDGFRALPALPDARHHAGVVVSGEDIYVFGGMRDARFTPLSRSYVLRDGASEWTEISPMPSARAAGVAANMDGVLVFVGGQGDGRNSAEELEDARAVYIYEPASDTWRQAAQIPTARDHAAGFVLNGELWVVGGRRLQLEPTLSVVEIYNLARDEWRSGPAMPRPRGGHAAVALDGRAYVSGGEQREGALRSVDIYDLEGGWTEGPQMRSPRHGHGMAALDVVLYAVGGADMPIFAAVDSMEVLSTGR